MFCSATTFTLTGGDSWVGVESISSSGEVALTSVESTEARVTSSALSSPSLS